MKSFLRIGTSQVRNSEEAIDEMVLKESAKERFKYNTCYNILSQFNLIQREFPQPLSFLIHRVKTQVAG